MLVLQTLMQNPVSCQRFFHPSQIRAALWLRSSRRNTLTVSTFKSYILPTPLTLQPFELERRMASKESSLFDSLRSLTQCPTIPHAYHAQTLVGTLIRTHTKGCHFVYNPILSPQHMLLGMTTKARRRQAAGRELGGRCRHAWCTAHPDPNTGH
jgi:hypothetical protein